MAQLEQRLDLMRILHFCLQNFVRELSADTREELLVVLLSQGKGSLDFARNVPRESGDEQNDPELSMRQVTMRKIKNNISAELKNHQLNLININKKLKFYSSFKFDNKKSEFLDHVKNPLHRKIASKFRLGNHKLQIQTERFTVPKTPANIRYHPHCMNFVEDEIHFLLKCMHSL